MALEKERKRRLSILTEIRGRGLRGVPRRGGWGGIREVGGKQVNTDYC